MEITSEKNIRRYFDEKEAVWYFSVVDVIAMVTDSIDARNYWKVLKNRLNKTQKELVTKCNQLKMMAKDGKFYLTDVASSETTIEILKHVPQGRFGMFEKWLEWKERDLYSPEGAVEETNLGEEEAKLLIDVYQLEENIFIKMMPAGLGLEDISIMITPRKVVVRGKRSKKIHGNPFGHFSESEEKNLEKNSEKNFSSNHEINYLHEELQWLAFSRIIPLPSPVQINKVEKMENHGLITIKLPKLIQE